MKPKSEEIVDFCHAAMFCFGKFDFLLVVRDMLGRQNSPPSHIGRY